MFRYVSAGAGCGKTTFILNSIRDLVRQLDKKKILIITYTNSCVEEIKKRIATIDPELMSKVHIYTFHGLCGKFSTMSGVFSENNNLELLLNYIYNDYYFPDSFKDFYNYFLCHTPIDNYLEVLKAKYSTKSYGLMEDIKGQIQGVVLKDYLTSKGTIRAKKPIYIEDEAKWKDNKALLEEYFQILNRDYNFLYYQQAMEVEEIRKHTNIYTYHHVILHILENITKFIQDIYQEYEHIFIDEVQDLSHIQFKIIEKLAEELVFLEGKSITIVGDINQSIYSFQGANRENFEKFIHYIQSIPSIVYEEVQLNTTYRFGGEILDFVNSTFTPHISPVREGSITSHPLARDQEQLLEQIYEEVINLTNNHPEQSILILFHRRSTLTLQLEERLESVKLTKKISGKDPMLFTFFALIKYLIFTQDSELINFLIGGMFIIPEPEFCQLVITNRDKDLWQTIKDQYTDREEVSVIDQLKKAGTLCDFLSIFTNSILHHNGYNFYGPNVNFFINELVKLGSIKLEYLLELEGRDLWFEQQGKIELSTIHNSKGREADQVLIIDGHTKPGNSRISLVENCPFYNFIDTEPIESEEFHNLLYVSVTRAKKHLSIFSLWEKHKDSQSLYSLIHAYKHNKEEKD